MSMFFKISLFFFITTVLTVNPAAATDSLVVSPPGPTTSDSISLSILARDWNCCTQFIYDSTAVTLFNDSTITLRFTFVPGLCPCPINPVNSPLTVTAVLRYKRGPLPAGNYSVFEVESQSCITGQICTNLVVQASIGKFTVSQPAATIFHQESVRLEDVGKLSQNGRVYDIRGGVVSSNLIGTSKRTSGVYFFKPDDHSAVRMKIWY